MSESAASSLTFDWRRSGRVLREMAYLPLAEDIPILFNSCRQGPRSLDWRSDRDAEITWIEAQVRALPLPPNCGPHVLDLCVEVEGATHGRWACHITLSQRRKWSLFTTYLPSEIKHH